MARNTSFTPYEEETVGAYDEEPGGSEFMAYGSAPSMALKDYSLPEDPMPLFLSEGAEESRQRGFGTGGERIPKRAVVWPRIFKAGVLAASAAAIAFAILSVGNPLALFADAKASLPAATADQSGATQTPNPQPAAAVQMASHGAPTPVLPSSAGVRASSPTARVTPTRDDIALALRAAQQSLVQTDPPPAAPEPIR